MRRLVAETHAKAFSVKPLRRPGSAFSLVVLTSIAHAATIVGIGTLIADEMTACALAWNIATIALWARGLTTERNGRSPNAELGDLRDTRVARNQRNRMDSDSRTQSEPQVRSSETVVLFVRWDKDVALWGARS